jgi:prepilin-type N-terminal cleavage/methylation domain-containing protein
VNMPILQCRSRAAGFTLIEMLVVLVVIGLLLALIIPNFVLFNERARRSAVRNNMHVVQAALEAYAVDNQGMYPSELVSWEEGDDAGMAAWFPGGEPFDEEGFGKAGRFPINPYTGRRYNSDSTDLDYETLYGVLGWGQAAQKRGQDPGCPYLKFGHIPDFPGGIGVATANAAGGVRYQDRAEIFEGAVEYGIYGFGRDVEFPMYDLDAEADTVDDPNHWVFMVLHH